MAKVELKQPIIDEIKALLDGAVAATVVDYRGLTVAQDTELRKALREAGVQYKVFKNTLIKRAAEGTDFAQLDVVLDGPTALAVSKDDAKAVQALAEIPSREELLGRLLGSIQSPVTNFARVLKQIAEKDGGEAA